MNCLGHVRLRLGAVSLEMGQNCRGFNGFFNLWNSVVFLMGLEGF